MSAGNANDDEGLRAYEEQLAFLERESDHQKQQILDLWDELAELKRLVARLARRLDTVTGEDPTDPG